MQTSFALAVLVAFVVMAAALSCQEGKKPDAASKPATGKADSDKSGADRAPAAKGGTQSDKAVAAVDGFIESKGIDTKKSGWKTSLPMPPSQKGNFDAAKKYLWKLVTNKGEIKVRLFPDVAPMHVSSTIYLTRLGFYDDTIFHRVITGFMAQGGCPLGRGMGSPGYKYDGEYDPKVRHDRPGLLSMANAGPGTDGSQFFLTFVPTPHLNGKHTIFGEVVSGMEVVKALEKAGSQSGTPSEKLTIEKATIEVE
jgi:cyclophilin family peptidyl-prolyl cis-trans isomerase